MRIIAIKGLRDFWEDRRYRDSEQALKSWYREFSKADYSNFHEIRQKFGSADQIGDKRVVFNIAGNKYRLIVTVVYLIKTIYIKFVGTHAQYDAIDVKTVNMFGGKK
ncbi:MAG: type II toxin-antitoxin system HigB family toxin [Xanthomonadales bacterium]